MPQGILDYFAMEAIGAASTLNIAVIDHMIIEVGGAWAPGFGSYLALDHFALEAIGECSDCSQGIIDSFILEAIGQWAGF